MKLLSETEERKIRTYLKKVADILDKSKTNDEPVLKPMSAKQTQILKIRKNIQKLNKS